MNHGKGAWPYVEGGRLYLICELSVVGRVEGLVVYASLQAQRWVGH